MLRIADYAKRCGIEWYEVMRLCISDKTTITQGAMNDITFRTNPVVLDKREAETVFYNAMKGHIND